MTTAKDGCSNRIHEPGIWMPNGFPCPRIATGPDGLCNVCRAAKRRGERRAEVIVSRDEARYAISDARDSIVEAAVKFRAASGLRRAKAQAKLFAAVDALLALKRKGGG